MRHHGSFESSRHPRRGRRGFTLVELLAVMAIAAAMAALVAPRLVGSQARQRVLGQARAVLAAARMARARAAIEGRSYVLVVDGTARTIAVARQRDPLAAPQEDGDPELEATDAANGWSRPIAFEADVTLAELELAPAGSTTRAPHEPAERHLISFGPNGDATAARLVFQGKRGDRIAVEVDPTLGVARSLELVEGE